MEAEDQVAEDQGEDRKMRGIQIRLLLVGTKNKFGPRLLLLLQGTPKSFHHLKIKNQLSKLYIASPASGCYIIIPPSHYLSL